MLGSWFLIVWLLQYLFTCNGIYNTDVSLAADIQTQIVKVVASVAFINDEEHPISTYEYHIDDDIEEFTAQFYIDYGHSRRYLDHVPSLSKEHNTLLVNLGQSLIVNGSFKFAANIFICNKVKTYGIYGNDTHLVQYTSNLYYYSKYKTDAYTAFVAVNVTQLVEKPYPFEVESQIDLSYSEKNIKPFRYHKIRIVYKMDIPFFRITTLRRTVIVSHWHNILVRDEVDVTNMGPPLRDFQYYHKERATHKLLTAVPDTARDIRIYDDLGEIHNFDVEHQDARNVEGRHEQGSFLILFDPRFSLLRTYKAHYVLEYALPTYTLIKYRDIHYQVDIYLRNLILPEAIIEKSILRIILPQGAQIHSEGHHPKFGSMQREMYNEMLSFSRPVYIFNTTYVTQYDVHVIALRYIYHYGSLWIPAIILSFYLWMFNLSICVLKRICAKLNFHVFSD